MTTDRQIDLAMETLVEIEEERANSNTEIVVKPTLAEVLAHIGRIPREALYLGMAQDGIPVLLNLYDSMPGPILVTAESGAGRTTFLKAVANSTIQTHSDEQVRFAVITSRPEEWENGPLSGHLLAVVSSGSPECLALIASLAHWARANKPSRQSILLLIDDLDVLAHQEPDALQDLRWLLLRGPARRVWPIVTLNADVYRSMLAWLPLFRMRIFGRIQSEEVAMHLSGNRNAGLGELVPRVEFAMPESGNWLRFWLPSF